MNATARRFLALLMLAAVLAGCSTTRGEPDARDPFEGFNRAMFTFNDKFDEAALKPAATVYRSVLPSFVQTAIGNFFGNIGDVWTAFNHFLQGNIEKGLSDTMRVAVNTTFGFGGLLDISSEAGLPKHKQDLGVTLGVWGVPSGPYVVLPVLGSSTLRDSAMVPLDYKGDPWGQLTPVHTRNAGTLVRLVDRRAALLDASNLLEDAAFDRYEFVKDAFLQQRASKIDDSRGDQVYDDEDYGDYGEADFEEAEPPASSLEEVSAIQPQQTMADGLGPVLEKPGVARMTEEAPASESAPNAPPSSSEGAEPVANEEAAASFDPGADLVTP